MLTAAQTKLPLKMSEQLPHLDDSADKRAGISNSISNKQRPQNTPPPNPATGNSPTAAEQPRVISGVSGGAARQIAPRLTCSQPIDQTDHPLSLAWI